MSASPRSPEATPFTQRDFQRDSVLVPTISKGKGKKKKRKLNGFLFIRNLRPGTKSRFKSVVARRDDVMTDVVEALMLLYAEKPDCCEKQLQEVKSNRVHYNKVTYNPRD